MFSLNYQFVVTQFRNATPSLSIFFLLFITNLPYGASRTIFLIPPLALIGIFHWGIYRPDLLPRGIIFAIGILQDVIDGGILGIWALIYLLVHTIMKSQRKFFFGRSFIIEWYSFGVVVFFVYLFIWMIGILFYNGMDRSDILFFQLIILICIYPLLTWLMGKVRHLVGGI
tara:strand:+ start:462 stop:974 length:513 start_codon:yes stop_codon:yes gene_type:complete